MEDLKVIQRWAKEANDPDWYDRCYTLMLFMAGDGATVNALLKGELAQQTGFSSSPDLPEYPYIIPQLRTDTTTNHSLVNSRINVAGLAWRPEIKFGHPDSLIGEFNREWIWKRWEQGAWEQVWEQCGMEFESCGMAGAAGGLDDFGRTAWSYVSVLDCLFDIAEKQPNNWRWVNYRVRSGPEEARDTYKDALTKTEWESIIEDRQIRPNGGGNTPSRQCITAWNYFDRDHHVVFLKSLHGGIPIRLKETRTGTKWEKCENDKAGHNPFAVLPFAWWHDGWAPRVFRPTGKADNVVRSAALLEAVEASMVQIMRSRRGMDTINVDALDERLYNEIKAIRDGKSEGLEELKKKIGDILFVNGDTDIANAFKRISPDEIPSALMNLRGVLMQELNAATGVQDMMRGQALTGERTRYEVESLNALAGSQGQHMRRSFALFLRRVMDITRKIGADFDDVVEELVLPSLNMVVSTRDYPARAMLSEPMGVHVEETSLIIETPEDKRNKAYVLWKQMLEGFVNLGVADRQKSFEYLMKMWGVRNPMSELGVTAPPAMMPPGMPGQMPGGMPGQMPPGMPPAGMPQGTPAGAGVG